MFGFYNNLLILGIKEEAMEVVYKLALNADAIIYSIVNFLYKIFLIVGRVRLLTEADVVPIVNRVYILIGTIMLFMLAYALLKSIVTADGKMVDAGGKTVFNLIKAIILIAVIPTVFDFAYNVQDALLRENTIGKIIVGNTGIGGKDSNEIIKKGGMKMTTSVLSAFLVPSGSNTRDTDFKSYEGETDPLTLNKLMEIVYSDENFWNLDMVAEELALGKDKSVVTYYWGASFVAGAYLLWLLISYCLSLGVRVVKLVFYEIIAPIPILVSILPSKKDMLSKWIKVTITTFVEVFVRVAILYLVVFIIALIDENFSSIFNAVSISDFETFFAKAIIVMGVITFAKQAPQLLSDILGVDSKNMSLGIKDQLKSAGFYTAGGFIAGTIAGRGNPLAGIRGAHYANANAGITGITTAASNENAYRRSIKSAKANGVTFWTRTANNLRGYLGMESLGEKADREIENKDYIVQDRNGRSITMNAKTVSALDKEYEENNNKINSVNEKARIIKVNKDSNDQAISLRSVIKNEALDKIQEDNSTITRDLRDDKGNIIFTGNYQAMKKYIDTRSSIGDLSAAQINSYTKQLGDHKDSMWEEYADAAINGREINGKIIDNGKISTAYDNLRKGVLDVENGILREVNGNVILNNRIENLEGMDFVKEVFKIAQTKSNEQSVDIESINRTKTSYEQRNAEIDRMKKAVDEQKALAKQSDKYKSYQAASKIEKSKNGSINNKNSK